MSVSVRSSVHHEAALGGTRGATLSTSRHSAQGAILRSSAAQNILSSRHSNTETKFHQAGRRISDAPGKNGNTAVITLDELQRIRAQCSQNPFAPGMSATMTASGYADLEEEQARYRERAELQEKSKARVSQWPNTMQAMRKRREEERLQRLEDEELERRRIDALEYELQQQTRMKAVERANKHAYDTQDQVKAFKAKLLMSDVLAEREVQLELK